MRDFRLGIDDIIAVYSEVGWNDIDVFYEDKNDWVKMYGLWSGSSKTEAGQRKSGEKLQKKTVDSATKQGGWYWP